MIILGIETSCDETALCLLEIMPADILRDSSNSHNAGNADSVGNAGSTRSAGVDFHKNKYKYRVLEHAINSQINIHAEYGGVFPALAKREHAKNLVPMLESLMASPRLSGNATGAAAGKAASVVNGTIKSVVNMVKISLDPTVISLALEHLKSQEPDLLANIEASTLTTNKLNIDRIAVTAGPGLEPALWVGVNFASALSKLWGVPVTSVNHMEGHILGSLIEHDAPSEEFHSLKDLPSKAVALLISGGHTELVEVTVEVTGEPNSKPGHRNTNHPHIDYRVLGATRDDALGEAYDKIARMLDLPYPGGPHIARLAEGYRARLAAIDSKTDQTQILVQVPKFPRPMLHTPDLDFSFAGLKTSVLYHLREMANISPYQPKKMRHDTFIVSDDIKQATAYAFEEAITEVLVTKTRKALETTSAQALIVGGGVIANTHIRSALSELATEFSVPILLPAKTVSGDNALMIALAGALSNSFNPDSLNHSENPNLRAQGNIRVGEDFQYNSYMTKPA